MELLAWMSSLNSAAVLYRGWQFAINRMNRDMRALFLSFRLPPFAFQLTTSREKVEASVNSSLYTIRLGSCANVSDQYPLLLR